jgi:X-X-X-Leu-X-X-Gly heptad repeat protein
MFGANDATNKLGSGLNSASNGLNQLGTGLDQFGQALASARSGGNSGLADLLGSFTKVGIGAFNSSAQFQSAVLSGIPGLWADGGFTGNIDEKSIAGYVHGGEFVFSKRAVDKIGLGTLDAMHRQARAGYASGGYVTASANDNAWGAWATQSQGQPAGTAAAPVINVINRNGSAVKVRDRSTANGVALDVMIDEAVADKVSQIGSNTGRAMQSQFGLNRGLSRR